MDVQLKVGEIVKIISLIPNAFHALSLTATLKKNAQPSEINIYFSDSLKDLNDAKFSEMDYIQFKSVPRVQQKNFRPAYNNLEKVYNYCFVVSDRQQSTLTELTMHYETK